jgi:RNA polymerase sigma-70 factor, ECF subfamily
METPRSKTHPFPRSAGSTVATDASELVLPLLAARRRLALERRESAPISAPSDEELLERIKTRDEEALLTLFRRYHALVYAIGRRILGDEGEAEDLVQEVFLRLSTRSGTFDPTKGAGRSWFVQMIYRRAFDRRAYLGRRHFYRGTDFDDTTNALEGSTSLEDDVIERLTAQQLRAAFAELTARQRETLEMFFFEGLKLSEIAGRTGEDLKNVRHHYYRGLERLRQIVRRMTGNEKSQL